MCPCFEPSGFVHSRYTEADVVNDVFIVCMQYTSTSSLVVVPRGEKFGGKMVVRVACHFPIKVGCCVAICFLMLVISKNFFLTVSFVMCCSFTSAILMPIMS